MGVPHITSFCWCFGLEMGTKFIGFLHLGVSAALMVVCSVMADGARGYIGTVDDEDLVYSRWYKLALSAAVLSAVHVALALLLLYCTFKRAAGGVRVWVWAMGVLYLAGVVATVVSAALHGLAGSGSDIFLSFLEGVLFFGLLLYCMICVNSYYMMLRSAADMAGPKGDY